MTRYNKRIDQNHTVIVRELRDHGVCVVDLSGCAQGISDIVMYSKGHTVFAEIKYGSAAVVKKSQVKFLSEWRGNCGIARSLEDALNMVNDPENYCLTQSQKDKLAVYYQSMSAPAVALNVLEKVYGKV